MATCRECGKEIGAGAKACPGCDRVRVPVDVKLLLIGAPFLGASVVVWESSDYVSAIGASAIAFALAGAAAVFVTRFLGK